MRLEKGDIARPIQEQLEAANAERIRLEQRRDELTASIAAKRADEARTRELRREIADDEIELEIVAVALQKAERRVADLTAARQDGVA